MPITFDQDEAALIDVASVEEAEPLLAWLQDHKDGRVNLAACTHLHAAVLQVLMAGRATIGEFPDDAGLSAWMTAALSHEASLPSTTD